MSLLRNTVRALPRAGLARTHPGTVSLSWALRSASISTSSSTTESTPWAPEHQNPATPAPERRGPPPGKCYRAVHIAGLDPSVTLTDLIQSIAATAPVGMILSAQLVPATPRTASSSPPEGSTEAQPSGASAADGSEPKPDLKADIIFGNSDAPYKLRQAAWEKTFLVKGKTPFVTINTSLIFAGPKAELRRSRVLHIRGPPDAEGFDEETIRGVLTSNAAAMETVGALGVSSESVETREEDEGGGSVVRVMEWRFFGVLQARNFKRVLREHYGKRLQVDSAPDPCWDYRDMREYLRRVSVKGQGPTYRQLFQRPVASPSVPVYPAYFMDSAAPNEKHTPTTKRTPPTKSKFNEEPTSTEERTPTEVMESGPASTNKV
ncbi:hypothetical protein VP1G_05258 [Cytospora mali]|uniref:Uncharacterized protein n=1 Tax=Cytospora mali TaxID=578113 RepID=A0A194V1U6_CYTMA|nr:hypothetical protein VP1G_05258 [Valsa mali var. pyri (nom. inval.)]